MDPDFGRELTPWHTTSRVTVYHGDCLDVLAALPEGSIDAVVTDPPYGLEFMGRAWDTYRQEDRAARWRDATTVAGAITPSHLAGTPLPTYTSRGRTTSACQTCGKRDAFRGPHPCDDQGVADWATVRVDRVPSEMRAFGAWCQEWAAAAYRVLKPGGHLLAFGGSRTWHRLAVGIEEAGFDVRDTIMWAYGTGMPKSMSIPGKLTDPDDAARWAGWGTTLKPAYEPIVVARRPPIGSVARNVLRYGTGGLHVDACRVPMDAADRDAYIAGNAAWERWDLAAGNTRPDGTPIKAADIYDAYGIGAYGPHDAGRWPTNLTLDADAAAALDTTAGDPVSRFFPTFAWEPKAKGPERPVVWRHACDCDHDTPATAGGSCHCGTPYAREVHPTVKPVALMQWLCRLVTPPGGLVLDPFAGSGTTLEAASTEGFRAIGVEREADYLPLIRQRLDRHTDPVAYIASRGEDLGLFGPDAVPSPRRAPRPRTTGDAGLTLRRSEDA